MITGPQLRAARLSVDWSPAELATRAKVPLGTVQRAESSPGEPEVSITQLNALMKALWAGRARFSPAEPETDDGDQP